MTTNTDIKTIKTAEQSRFALIEEKSETSFEQIMQSIGAVATISKNGQMSN